MSTVLFGCRNEFCATEVSWPAADLAEHPDGGPICENCWDEEGPHWLDGNGGEDSDECLEWCALPRFVPEHEKHIADLEARLAAAERDAGRLDWLADQSNCGMVKFATGGCALNWDNRCTDRLATLREAIDAAMASHSEGDG